MDARCSRARLLGSLSLLGVVAATSLTGCNALFGITEGKPRPMAGDDQVQLACVDPQGLLIDDMEDGDSSVCALGGRMGSWWDFGDGTDGVLIPQTADQSLYPTRIEPGPRENSQYAAHFSGSGFTRWGAVMGLDLNQADNYDAGPVGGITFWMKSTTPVVVQVSTADTVPIEEGGQCDARKHTCNDHFSFPITAPGPGWQWYHVPFSALRQTSGNDVWDPRILRAIQFQTLANAVFDVWIDDLAFYMCAGPECQPTCSDPRLPVSCRLVSVNGTHSSCQPAGTKCATVISKCTDRLLIDDMEDGDDLICISEDRHGEWYSYHDDTNVALPEGPFVQTPIYEGRGTSRQAANLLGGGFLSWGAGMGFFLNGQQPYDASQLGGIKFWMTSDVPVSVNFLIPETLPPDRTAGTCRDVVMGQNCDNHFAFVVGPSPKEWVEYTVPFAALSQRHSYHGFGNLVAGSAIWDPSLITSIQFGSVSHSSFAIWIDDIRFSPCAGDACIPTCPAAAPMACPAAPGRPAGCWPTGTNCAAPPERLEITGLWGSGPNDVWAVGVSNTLEGRRFHWDGTTWTSRLGATMAPLWSVWGSRSDDVWSVGDQGAIEHWDGSAWSAIASGTTTTFNRVWGVGPNDIWAISAPGTMLHWDGVAWSSTNSSAKRLLGVWGSGPSDAWVVGERETVLHWDGAAWTAPSQSAVPFASVWASSVWGSGRDDVWAVGGAGAMLQWTGVGWVRRASWTTAFLSAVWGTGPSDIWAVGDLGTTLHWDGIVWSPVASGTTEWLSTLWGSGPDDVWAAGDAGVIIHWDGAAWSTQPLPSR